MANFLSPAQWGKPLLLGDMSYIGPCMGYQNDPNNIRIHDFGVLGDFGYILIHIGSKCVPERGKNDEFSNLLGL